MKCIRVALQWCCEPLVCLLTNQTMVRQEKHSGSSNYFQVGCWNVGTLIEADGDVCALCVCYVLCVACVLAHWIGVIMLV